MQLAGIFPIPHPEDCIDKMGNAKYVDMIGLLKRFWKHFPHIPCTDCAEEILAFVTDVPL